MEMEEDKPFVWKEYLERNGLNATPRTAFKHVIASGTEALKLGMLVAVSHSSEHCWIATVTLISGNLIRLRWAGKNNSEQFWSDGSKDLHALNVCQSDDHQLRQPEGLNLSEDDERETRESCFSSAMAAPVDIFTQGHGLRLTAVDYIQTGMIVDVQHASRCCDVWPAKVKDNVGGRLHLRPLGTESSEFDEWLFYLDERVHPLGWAQANGKDYTALSGIPAFEDLAQLDNDDNTIPAKILQIQHVVKKHKFEQGQKLEAMHPSERACYPATVTEVLDASYFIVEIDDLSADSTPVRLCCHSQSAFIFPITWCKMKGLKLNSPKGWKRQGEEFDWVEYLNVYDADPAGDELFTLLMTSPKHGFTQGQKLEVANPDTPTQMCAATVTRCLHHLLWVQLDHDCDAFKTLVFPADSLQLFPVGWCAEHQVELRPPARRIEHKKSRLDALFPEQRIRDVEDYRLLQYKRLKMAERVDDATWSPVVYFNHKCFSGPHLSKSRVIDLPLSVGPGPVNLVMKSVIHAVIHAGYKAARVLKELQLEGDANPHMQLALMKARQKAKKAEAPMELCTEVDQLVEFCQRTCLKLDCCPHLISLQQLNGVCPHSCEQFIKTKYSDTLLNNVGNDKKRGRKRKNAARSHRTIDEHGTVKRGRRKKKRYKRVNLMGRGAAASQYPTTTITESDYEEYAEFTYEELQNRQLNGATADNSIHVMLTSHQPPEAYQPPIKRRSTFDIPPPPAAKRHKTESSPGASNALQIDIKDDWWTDSNGVLPHFSPVKAEERLTLESNPLHWDVMQAVDFIKSTDCAHFAPIFVDQEIDGQAFMLMNLPTVQEHLDLKLGPAVKLCHQIERVKLAFFEQFAFNSAT